jgi:outer membrane protein W
MRPFSRVTLAIALLMLSTSAAAQSWEASVLIGQTPGVSLDQRAPELSDLNIEGGFTWGLQAGRLMTEHWGAEALWMQQPSGLGIETGDGTADLFTMTVRQLSGDVLYHFGSTASRVRPFVFGGLGGTFFSADDLDSETKVSFGLGGGIKYFRWDAIGVRAHVQYRPTLLNDEESADFCDSFGFCRDTLRRVEFAAGGVVRF